MTNSVRFCVANDRLGSGMDQDAAPLSCRSGFLPRNEGVHGACDLILVLILLVLTRPFFVVIGLALLLTQAAGIAYAGERLGKDRRPFSTLKFRTRDTRKAAAVTQDGLLPVGSNLETRLGKYLRASRLDELPQILDIIRGHTNVIGRPAVADLQEAEARYRFGRVWSQQVRADDVGA